MPWDIVRRRPPVRPERVDASPSVIVVAQPPPVRKDQPVDGDHGRLGGVDRGIRPDEAPVRGDARLDERFDLLDLGDCQSTLSASNAAESPMSAAHRCDARAPR